MQIMEQRGADNRLQYIVNDILAKARSRKSTSGDVDFHLKAYVTKSLKHHSARLVDILKDQFASNKSHGDIQSYLSHMDDYLTQCCRQRATQLREENETVKDFNNTHFNDVHAEALKRYSAVLTQDLRIAGTVVLDNLVQDKALSENGRQSIVERKTLSSVNSAFLKHCNGLSCTTFKETVLPALKNSNDEVNVELANDIEKDIVGISTFGTAKTLCVSCKIQNTVNYRRLADSMYEMNAISDNMRDDLSSSHLSNDTKWKQLLKKKLIKFLPRALKKKYPCLYRGIQLTPQNIMHCTCSIDTEDEEDMEVDSMSDVARMSGFLSRTNTTSSATERKSDKANIFTKESMNVVPDNQAYTICGLKTPRPDSQGKQNHQNQKQRPIHVVGKKRVQIWPNNIHDNFSVGSCNQPLRHCSPKSKSRIASLKLQQIGKPDSFPLTERERVQILPKNILRQANERKHRQEPFGSADVTLKGACTPGSKSTQIESLNQKKSANPGSVHMTEKEREQILQKNIPTQVNQKKQHQGPLSSAAVTSKRACLVGSKSTRIESLNKQIEAKPGSIHLTEKELKQILQKNIQRQVNQKKQHQRPFGSADVISKEACLPGSKSTRIPSLNQKIDAKTGSIHLTEKEREQMLQKNIPRQANQRQQQQGPLVSAEITLKGLCSARPKPRIYSVNTPPVPKRRPNHWPKLLLKQQKNIKRLANERKQHQRPLGSADVTTNRACSLGSKSTRIESLNEQIEAKPGSIHLTEKEREQILQNNIQKQINQKKQHLRPLGSADVTTNRACSVGSKSTRIPSLNQKIDAKTGSIHLTEKEREQLLQKDILRQANQRKQQQGPLGSADITLKGPCSARPKPRIYSVKTTPVSKMRPKSFA